VQGGVTYQDNHIAYDALGRMRWVADTRAYLSIDYDKVGNRTHIGTRLRDEALSTQQVPMPVEKDSQRYFQYDAMNRQTAVDAVDATDHEAQVQALRLSMHHRARHWLHRATPARCIR
jgi:hypothetical protein